MSARRKVHLPAVMAVTRGKWAVAFLDDNDRVTGPLLGQSEDLDEVVALMEKIRETNPDAVCIYIKHSVAAELVPDDHLYGM